MKYYIVWIEGLEYQTGEKIKAFDTDGRIIYTCRMKDAMRVKKHDIEAIKTHLTSIGIADWVIHGNTFVNVSSAPKGTIYNSKAYNEKYKK